MIKTGILQGNIAAIIILWSFGIVGVIANLIVIYISVRNKYFTRRFINQFHDVHNILITNLSIIDLLGCIYLLIISGADAYYSLIEPYKYGCFFTNSCHNYTNTWAISPMCSVARYIANIATITPAFITLFIAFDRYTKIIKFRSRYRFTTKRCKIAVAVAWLLSITFSTFMCIRAIQLKQPHSFRNYNNVCGFPNPNDFLFRMFSFAGFISAIGSYAISMILYLFIIYRIQEARHKIFDLRERAKRNTRTAEIRLCIITGILALTNFCSWLPNLVSFNISEIRSTVSLKVSIAYYHLSLLGYFLVFINSCANPVCYIIFLVKTFVHHN